MSGGKSWRGRKLRWPDKLGNFFWREKLLTAEIAEIPQVRRENPGACRIGFCDLCGLLSDLGVGSRRSLRLKALFVGTKIPFRRPNSALFGD
jgi:hypothetical protein